MAGMGFMRATCALLAASVSTIAMAQDQGSAPADAAAPQDDEIVVTAQRREQSLLDVPLAVSALSGDDLARQGITNSAQLGEAVPNLQINSPYGSTQPNFFAARHRRRQRV